MLRLAWRGFDLPSRLRSVTAAMTFRDATTTGTASRAGQIAQVFWLPLRFAQVHTAGFYDDVGFCDVPYCYGHWHVSETGYGYSPRGHGKSLDPHR